MRVGVRVRVRVRVRVKVRARVRVRVRVRARVRSACAKFFFVTNKIMSSIECNCDARIYPCSRALAPHSRSF